MNSSASEESGISCQTNHQEDANNSNNNNNLKKRVPLSFQNPYAKKHVPETKVSNDVNDHINPKIHEEKGEKNLDVPRISVRNPYVRSSPQQKLISEQTETLHMHQTLTHKIPINPYKRVIKSSSYPSWASQKSFPLQNSSTQLEGKAPVFPSTNPYYNKYGAVNEREGTNLNQKHQYVASVPKIDKITLPQNELDQKGSVHITSGAIVPTQGKDPSQSQQTKLLSIFENNFPKELLYDESRIKPIQDEYRLKLIQAANLNATLDNGWHLLPHQKVGVLKALQMRRCILAFDMGLGKTLIACVWAKAFKAVFQNLKIFVISPVSLKKEWEKTAIEATGLKCEPDLGKKSSPDSHDSLDMRISTWAKIPLRVPPSADHFIVICDEAHHLQNMESARTKDALKLMSNDRCVGVLLLTGTPMKNGKPCNLFPLLRAVRHPFGDDQKLYEVFFCNGRQKNFNGRIVWDANGSMNLPLLNKHISSHVFHKTKDECLKDLPPKEREFKVVPVSSRYQVQHNRALSDLANICKAIDEGKYGNDPGQEAMLGAFGRLRQIAAYAKIDAAVALTQSILEVEPSIVIFTYFVNVAKEVQKKLELSGWKSELLTGESKNRQEMVENFQNGLSPIFIATFGAGGVGLTLTAARTIILMDRPWTPGDALQAEDRVRRIGQTKPVKSIWMRAFEVDEQIDNLIEQKKYEC
jgi:SNF2 family DNA or RNA helicase